MIKPQNIDKWGLDDKNKKIVRRELGKWLKHFMDMSQQEAGNVYRCDFVNWDFFYFTKCHDLMGNKPEQKAVENSKQIAFRKDQVFMQLFLKTLLNDIRLLHSFCTHCGAENHVESITNGHMYFCPSCGKTDVSVYPDSAIFSFDEVRKKLWEWEKGGK